MSQLIMMLKRRADAEEGSKRSRGRGSSKPAYPSAPGQSSSVCGDAILSKGGKKQRER